MSLKIALCKSALAGPVSGADEVMVNYAVHLREVGHTVMVVLLYPPSIDDQFYQRLKRAGVEVRSVVETSALFAALHAVRQVFFGLIFFIYVWPGSFHRLRRIWQLIHRGASRVYTRKCRRFFSSMRPDLLHVFTPDAGAALMIRAGHQVGIPVLYHEMGTPHYLSSLEPYYRDLTKVLPLCDEFAALSPSLAAQWSAKFPFLQSVSVLPMIVDDRNGHAPAQRRREIVFGYAARIEEGKGPMALVEALAHLNRESSVGVVRMAGIGPQLPALKELVKQLGVGEAFEFVGHYTEPTGRGLFMSSLDVFVLPSLAEGTPNSVIEAMAYGLPVIASNVGGIPDLLAGGAGILIPPGDGRALGEAMQRLAADPSLRQRMGRAARERYLRLFSRDAVLSILTSTYERVGSRKASRMIEARRSVISYPWATAGVFTDASSLQA
jgi:glycosyltransferase involved in cell wall biosynthesis